MTENKKTNQLIWRVAQLMKESKQSEEAREILEKVEAIIDAQDR